MGSRPRAFFVYPDLAPRGGAEAVAAWMIESLKTEYDVTVLTWSPPHLDGLNAIYGTRLRREDARWISPGPIARRAAECIPYATGWWQKRSWLMRMSRRLHPAHDVVLSSASEFDFGRPGIQYVNYPWMAPMYAALQRQQRFENWRSRTAIARRAWRAAAGFRFSSMLENLTLANSDWGADVYRRAYGREAHTLYPPVAGNFAETPWEKRQDAFAMVTRLEPDKNHLRVFDIISAVRRRHPGVELHVAGTRLRTPAGEAYHRALRSRIDREGGWITLHEDPSREELLRLLRGFVTASTSARTSTSASPSRRWPRPDFCPSSMTAAARSRSSRIPRCASAPTTRRSSASTPCSATRRYVGKPERV